MNTLEQDFQEQAQLVSEREVWIKRREALEELSKNKHFQTLILDGYIQEYALDRVSLLAHDGVVENGLRPQMMEMLVAISRLQDYFRVVVHQGRVDQEIEEILDESESEVE